MEIIPAILEKDFSKIQEKIEFLASIERKYNIDFKTVQIDLCDGVFVENKTWLPNSNNKKEADSLEFFKSFFNFEFHLMCKDQVKYFLKMEELKARSVVIHLDNILFSVEVAKIINKARETYTKIIVCAKIDFLNKNREEVLSFLEKYEDVDLQIMGIEKIGVQGQEFSEKCLPLIKFFRRNFSEKDLSIQVDGSMNPETLKLVQLAGANKVLVGSYLLKNLEEIEFVTKFRNLTRI